ncbi:Fic family protein [Oliverpabstia intestinalis]|uniref:Fic family protein n=1 Tax=Oliverpabstia intestinalis TaxID=2606633 RepID=UPI003F8C827D
MIYLIRSVRKRNIFRSLFKRNHLQPAIEMNLVRMTIPDKPNSRNQRYVKI